MPEHFGQSNSIENKFITIGYLFFKLLNFGVTFGQLLFLNWVIFQSNNFHFFCFFSTSCPMKTIILDLSYFLTYMPESNGTKMAYFHAYNFSFLLIHFYFKRSHFVMFWFDNLKGICRHFNIPFNAFSKWIGTMKR